METKGTGRNAAATLPNFLALCRFLGLTFHSGVPHHRAVTACELSTHHRQCNSIASGLAKRTHENCLQACRVGGGSDSPEQMRGDSIEFRVEFPRTARCSHAN